MFCSVAPFLRFWVRIPPAGLVSVQFATSPGVFCAYWGSSHARFLFLDEPEFPFCKAFHVTPWTLQVLFPPRWHRHYLSSFITFEAELPITSLAFQKQIKSARLLDWMISTLSGQRAGERFRSSIQLRFNATPETESNECWSISSVSSVSGYLWLKLAPKFCLLNSLAMRSQDPVKKIKKNSSRGPTSRAAFTQQL